MEAKKAFGQYRIEWIKLSNLRIHPTVQRKLDPGRVNSLTKEWDPALCRPLDVVQNGHCYLVFEGQTRLEAARLVYKDDEQMLPCHVHEGLNVEEQAERFLGLNDTKQVRTSDKWIVRKIAKDPVVLAIEAILVEKHLVVSQQASDGCVRAVAALEAIYSRPKGQMLLNNTLTLIERAWGNSSDALDGVMLRGVAFVLERCGAALDLNDLARKLAKHGTAASLMGESRTLAKISSQSVTRALAENICGIWNRSRKESFHVKL